MLKAPGFTPSSDAGAASAPSAPRGGFSPPCRPPAGRDRRAGAHGVAAHREMVPSCYLAWTSFRFKEGLIYGLRSKTSSKNRGRFSSCFSVPEDFTTSLFMR